MTVKLEFLECPWFSKHERFSEDSGTRRERSMLNVGRSGQHGVVAKQMEADSGAWGPQVSCADSVLIQRELEKWRLGVT
jgi:hypothetical protein